MSRSSRAGAIEIAIAATVRADAERDALLLRVARRAIVAEGFKTASLSIAIVGARRMAALHQQFMSVDGPTDVLTFDLGSDPQRRSLVGEIVVCQDIARRQCGVGRSAHAIHRELALYVTHGILHLAGYDDHATADFARMHAREDALLERMGVGRVFET